MILSNQVPEFRVARIDDIPQMQVVRHAVKENRLSNPALVTDADCEDYITRRGKGWVCAVDETVVGFSIVDLIDHNVWALFVTPRFEQHGIGRTLHDMMIDWYFKQTQQTIWLGTSPQTRAEKFYRLAGWETNGLVEKNELRFEMTFDRWKQRNQKHFAVKRLGG